MLERKTTHRLSALLTACLFAYSASAQSAEEVIEEVVAVCDVVEHPRYLRLFCGFVLVRFDWGSHLWVQSRLYPTIVWPSGYL